MVGCDRVDIGMKRALRKVVSNNSLPPCSGLPSKEAVMATVTAHYPARNSKLGDVVLGAVVAAAVTAAAVAVVTDSPSSPARAGQIIEARTRLGHRLNLLRRLPRSAGGQLMLC